MKWNSLTISLLPATGKVIGYQVNVSHEGESNLIHPGNVAYFRMKFFCNFQKESDSNVDAQSWWRVSWVTLFCNISNGKLSTLNNSISQSSADIIFVNE